MTDQKKEHPTQHSNKVDPSKGFVEDPIAARRKDNDPNDPREDQPQNEDEAAIADPAGVLDKGKKKHK